MWPQLGSQCCQTIFILWLSPCLLPAVRASNPSPQPRTFPPLIPGRWPGFGHTKRCKFNNMGSSLTGHSLPELSLPFTPPSFLDPELTPACSGRDDFFLCWRPYHIFYRNNQSGPKGFLNKEVDWCTVYNSKNWEVTLCPTKGDWLNWLWEPSWVGKENFIIRATPLLLKVKQNWQQQTQICA